MTLNQQAELVFVLTQMRLGSDAPMIRFLFDTVSPIIAELSIEVNQNLPQFEYDATISNLKNTMATHLKLAATLASAVNDTATLIEIQTVVSDLFTAGHRGEDFIASTEFFKEKSE